MLDDWAARHAKAELVRPRIERHGLDAYRRSYLRPLLDLMVGYLRTGDPAYGYVYMDERCRMLEEAPDGDRRDELRELIEGDSAGLAEAIGPAAALDGALRDLHEPLLEPSSQPELEIALVGDCLFTEVRAFLVPMIARRLAVP